MTKEYIENYVGLNVRLTMIDNSQYEGILWFVMYEDEKVLSICVGDFSFEIEEIKNIELIEKAK